VPVTKHEFKVGRNATNDLQVINGKVSGTHCKLVRSGHKNEIIDCSSNGTFKNGERIDKKATLGNGDVIHLLIAGEGVTVDQQIGFTVNLQGNQQDECNGTIRIPFQTKTPDFGLSSVLS